jgi:hypothetical protein
MGAKTTFYRLSIKETIKKLVLHWSCHPLYNPGMYYWDGSKIIIVNEFCGQVTVTRQKYDFPENYPFRKDGKLRSPWYDNECDRATHPMQIAQELDMDAFAADFQYFDGELIQDIEKENVRPPFWEGDIEFDADTLEPLSLTEGRNGPLKLWIYPDVHGKLPEDLKCGCGFDISAGTGASNSVGSFGNLKTNEKIGEYADPWIKPEAFARKAFALTKFFNDAFMCPDGGGPGRTFCDELIRLGFRNLYYRRNEEGLTKKVSDKPGVFLNTKEKAATMGKYRRALKDRTFIQRSHEANQECLAYVFTTGNAIEHSAALNSVDPSGAGDSHGDRVIGDALLWKCMEFLKGGSTNTNKSPDYIPENCYAAIKKRRERDEKKEAEW